MQTENGESKQQVGSWMGFDQTMLAPISGWKGIEGCAFAARCVRQ